VRTEDVRAGRAAEAYARQSIKAAKDSSRPAADSRTQGETQGHFRGPSPQDVALTQGVMQALYSTSLHARRHIVVAIPAVDLAVEVVV
jgi:hypothetical protein